VSIALYGYLWDMAEQSDLQSTPTRRITWTSSAEHSQVNTSTRREEVRTVKAWREQWRQLGLQAWSAESDGRRETQNPRSLSHEYLEELRAMTRKTEEEFRTWDKDLWGGLAKVRKRIQVLARNIHFSPQEDAMRRVVQAAEHDLRIFAEQMRQEEEEFAALECSLQDALESSLVRFEGWCSNESALHKPFETPQKPSRPPSCSRLRHADTHSNTGIEAKQLESMHEQLDCLESSIAMDGGSTGGWSHDDHETFLRVFRKLRRKTGVEFIADAQQSLPHKRHEDLVAHISWLLLYEDRQLQKRQLVEKWRCMRAAATKESLMEPEHDLTAAAVQEEKHKRSHSHERLQKELKDRRQCVAEWRNKRNEELRARREEQQRRAKEKKEQEACECRRRKEQRHQILEAMRMERAGSEGLLGSTLRNPMSNIGVNPISQEDKKRVAERNAAHLQRRAGQLENKRAESDVQHFGPPQRSLSVGATAAYRHVESRIEESIKFHVERSRIIREEASLVEQHASKYKNIPGNFAHQGVVRTMRKAVSWRPHFGA